MGATEGQNLRLVPDDSLAVQFFENSLQSQLGSSAVGLTLHSLTAQVSQNRLPGHVDEFDCNVGDTGRLTGDTMGTFPVSVAFHGLGQYLPGRRNAAAIAETETRERLRSLQPPIRRALQSH